MCFFYRQSIKRKDDPQEVKVQMQFVVYGTRPSKDKSGAYLFLPDGKAKVLRFLLACHCDIVLHVYHVSVSSCFILS